MLHNSGAFGPGEAPVDVTSAVNMAQIPSPINVGQNFNNFSKIATQTDPGVIPHYNLNDYSRFGHPPLTGSPQINPYQGYVGMGFPHNFSVQNSALQNTGWQNGMLHMNHSSDMFNYPVNIDRNVNNVYKNDTVKPYPLNVPDPAKAFQKLDNDTNFLYNTHNFEKNFDLTTTRPLLDNSRRKSLENTVKIIENLLMNTVKNRELNQDRKSQIVEKVYENSDEESVDSLSEETFEQEQKIQNDESVKTKNKINDEPKTVSVEVTAQTDINLNKEHTDNEEAKIEDIVIKPEIDGNYNPGSVTIKVESMSWTDTECFNPFQRDVNGVPREDVSGDVVDGDNNVVEAMVAAKSGSTTSLYECPYCSLVFSHPKRFLVHTKWHSFGLTNEKRMEVAREREMRRNQRREARVVDRMNSKEVTTDGAGVKVYQCRECEKSFCSKGSLKNHRQRSHPTKIRECKICQKSFLGWMALRSHVATHNTDSTFQCPDCPKKFKHAHSLAKHRDTHLEKTVSCSQCPKMFGTASQLKTHLKTHERASKGASYHCSYCAKAFYEAYSLQVHERTHRNERPFLCDICNTSFGTNSSLKRHLRVSHSSSKPFSCPACHRSFMSAGIRDRHHARQHGDPARFIYHCEACDCRYLKLKDLQKHMYKIHPQGKRKKKNGSDVE